MSIPQRFTDIADAIRAKNGSQSTYTPAQMPAAIAAIPSGGDPDENLIKSLNDTLTTLDLEDSGLTEIPDYAFYNRSALTSVKMPIPSASHPSLSIGNWSFYRAGDSNGMTVSFQESPGHASDVTIGDRGFQYSKVTSVTFTGGDHYITLGQYAFAGCSLLTSFTMGNYPNYRGYLLSVGNNAFKDCSALTSIILENVAVFGSNVFENCSSLSTVTFRNSFLPTTIPTRTFWECYHLSSITIPNNVTTIDTEAFAWNGNHTWNSQKIYLGPNITTIGSYAFGSYGYQKNGCELHISATTPPANTHYSAFTGSNMTVYVPAASLSAYQTAWGSLSGISSIVAES